MIVVDDCLIDKEFNARVERLVGDGLSEAEAVALAREDLTLDPFIPVAPIFPYQRLRYASAQGIREGQTIGYFPIVGSDDMEEGYIDFVRTVPVSRRLLRGPFAALGDAARSILRWKLAQFYAARNFSIDAEIMAAVGSTITGDRVVTDTKKLLVVDLELDHGANRLLLRQEPRRTSIPEGHTRGR
mgnify:CR=1 FL=1